jgi:hypothetical protein
MKGNAAPCFLCGVSGLAPSPAWAQAGSLAVFVKNATKTQYMQYALGQPLGNAFSQVPPRTFGDEASVKF